MTRYVVRRVLGAVPLVLGIATLVFFFVHLAPGDPSLYFMSPSVPAETLERIRESFGLDQPVHVRYLKWIASLARGDLGVSFVWNRPVMDVVAEILPNTLLLSGCAVLVAFGAGIVLGVIQAVRQYSLTDSVLSVLALFFYSMPAFWLALMLILTFGLFARNVWEWPIWFPASGMRSVDFAFMTPWEKVVDVARHLVLPTVSLALVMAAGIARYMRGSMLEVIRQDYVRTARAKGLGEGRVIFRHALKNGLIPIVTLLGLYLPFLFSGTVYVEHVFGWPGMGKLMVDSVLARDYPMVMGGALVFAVLVVVGNLVADMLYAVVDPRIRYE